MKKFALTVTLLGLWAVKAVHAAEFSCSSGDVTCLIAAINDANGMTGQHTINLEAGIYTLQVIDNLIDGSPQPSGGGNGLPSITGSIRIQASADDPATVIERDAGAQRFRIFHVSVGGELSLDGITVKSGNAGELGSAILNRGIMSFQDSILTDTSNGNGVGAPIYNFGTLIVLRSVITDNLLLHEAGGILNDTGGSVVVESSSISHNFAFDVGAILNREGGSVVLRNSAVAFNRGGMGIGGISNDGGVLEIINSTIAENRGFFDGGIINGGKGNVSITNSTIRENEASGFSGIDNIGTMRVQNTIIAGNFSPTGGSNPGPDCRGTVISLGNNLIGDLTGCTVNLQPSDLTGDPGLDALVEEDLPGRTFYPVLAGSPVIDNGNPNACLQTDQLGLLRVGICDMGAVEFRGPVLTVRRDVIRAGRSIVARWRAIPAPTSTDWIGLYLPGSPNTAFIDWIYVSCSKTPGHPDRRGSCDFPIPDSLAPGTYELRLLANDGFMGLASSDSFMVRPRREGLASQAP